MKAVILSLILALPQWHQDKKKETQEQRESRANVISVSIDRASDKPWIGTKKEKAVLLVMLGFFESRFARHVHEDKCGRWECDPFNYKGRIVHRAKSIWQVQSSRTVPYKFWLTIGGISQEATDRSAVAASNVLDASRKRCGEQDWVFTTVSAYATGRTCKWPKARNRVHLYKKLMAKVEKMENETNP